MIKRMLRVTLQLIDAALVLPVGVRWYMNRRYRGARFLGLFQAFPCIQDTKNTA